MSLLRRTIVKLLNPWVWGSDKRSAARFADFALAEASSRLDMLVAARLTECPKRAALYITHATDEGRHAKVFRQRAKELHAANPKLSSHVDHESLYERLGEQRFLAFVHQGETKGRVQFEEYRDYMQRKDRNREKKIFMGVLTDECRHESYTRELLVELSGSEKAAKKVLRWTSRFSAWRAFRRQGSGMASVVYAVLMGVLYVLSLPLTPLMRARMRAK